MKTRLVLWGTNAQNERVLIAMELRATDNRVDIWTFLEPTVTNTFDQDMHNKWRVGEEVAFPEGFTKLERELTISDSLLPDELKTDRTDLINRAQTEWHFIVLSTKLYDAYKDEINEIGNGIRAMADYTGDAWNSLKEFWEKVQVQVRERNLYREHADQIKETVNELFGILKDKRSEMENIFQQQSGVFYDQFSQSLDDLEGRISKNARFNAIFDELKEMQRSFREAKLTREHGNQLWERLDTAFKAAKDKRFGDGASDVPASDRIERRYEGLMAAISKMQQSIDRDKEELAFQKDKIAASEGQLEAQIRQAKILMIESRIQSKEEKLKEMLQTREDLETKMENIKVRDQKRKEREAADEARIAAKKAAEEKIANQIKEGGSTPAENAETTETVVEAAVEAPATVDTAAATEAEGPLDGVMADAAAVAAVTADEA